jgi:putative ABC transport system permease protein
MSALTEIAAVSMMNIRSLPQRIGTSSVVVIGIAGVVAVLISVLAMSTGLVKALQNTGPDNRAIVVSTGANAELVSVLTNEETLAIGNSAGIKKGVDGRALASPEILMIVNLFKRDGSEAGAPLRGITQQGFAVHPEIEVVSGRGFRHGVDGGRHISEWRQLARVRTRGGLADAEFRLSTWQRVAECAGGGRP